MSIFTEWAEELWDGVVSVKDSVQFAVQDKVCDAMFVIDDVLMDVSDRIDSVIEVIDQLVGTDSVDEAKRLVQDLEKRGAEELEQVYMKYRDEMSDTVRREFEKRLGKW